MNCLVLFLALVLQSSLVFSQTSAPTPIQESLSYFKDGVVFEHKPIHFKTTFRFRMQNRFTYETNPSSTGADNVQFTVRRMRLRLDGNVLDPRLLYRVQLSFTRGDMDYDRTEYPNILRDAAVGWKHSDYTTFWYGQMKLPGNRQRVNSSGDLQFVDRSIVNATFNIDRDLAAQVHHRFTDERPLWLKLAIGNGDGRGTDNPDNGLSYTARTEWLPLGAFTDGGDYFEGDLAREPEPKVSIGAVYSINKKVTRTGGQIGREFDSETFQRDLETFFADLLFKYRGFSFASEFAKRTTSNPYFVDAGRKTTIYAGEGFNAQAGYIFDNNVEPALRFTRLWADSETLKGSNDQIQYTAAVSKYINKHRVKVQTDLSFDEQMNSRKDTHTNAWIYRLQVEIGI